MRIRRHHPIWDDVEKIREAVSKASSVREALTYLGRPHSSGNYQMLKGRCLKFDLPYPRMSSTQMTSYAKRATTLSLEETFSNRGIRVNGTRLRELMVKSMGVSDECAICGQPPIWQGLPLTLEVDHLDGNSFNNEITNLRILCGHCHSQTDNFRGRNSRKDAYNYCSCGHKISKSAVRCSLCTD